MSELSDTTVAGWAAIEPDDRGVWINDRVVAAMARELLAARERIAELEALRAPAERLAEAAVDTCDRVLLHTPARTAAKLAVDTLQRRAEQMRAALDEYDRGET